jgi:hypothetical protein
MFDPLPIQHQNSLIAKHSAKGLHHFAITLIESYNYFWNLNPQINEALGYGGRTTEAILADMNADYDKAHNRNMAHYQSAAFCNENLAKTGDPLRVPMTMPHGFSDDGTQFIYTPPTPPAEPLPEEP